MRAPVAALAAVTALACATSACSGDPSSKKVPSRFVPPPASTARLSGIPLEQASQAPASDPATRRAAAALLGVNDLPAGFRLAGFSDLPLPQPCAAKGSTAILSRVKPRTHVGHELYLTSPQAVLTEEIDVFRSAQDATAATNLLRTGMNCQKGNFYLSDGTPQRVDVAGPKDISGVVGVPVDTLLSWTMQNGNLTASFLVARSGAVLTTLTFLAPTTSDLAKLPSGPAVAHVALIKVRAARLR